MNQSYLRVKLPPSGNRHTRIAGQHTLDQRVLFVPLPFIRDPLQNSNDNYHTRKARLWLERPASFPGTREMEDRTVASWRSLIPRPVTVDFSRVRCVHTARSTLDVNLVVSLTLFILLFFQGLCVDSFLFFFCRRVLQLMHVQSSFYLITLVLVPFLLFLPQVCAHGYIAQVTIDGTAYIGNVPNAQPTPSIVRQINTIDPVKGASNAYLNCGQDAQKAALVANANPGSQVQFLWKDGDGTDVSLFPYLAWGERWI